MFKSRFIPATRSDKFITQCEGHRAKRPKTLMANKPVHPPEQLPSTATLAADASHSPRMISQAEACAVHLAL
ncbi:hypothetical protein LSM04_005128 [Trypanosoma melophagium]|uniref:uncharacterized protein n=1 Tax=Trypanosoma melophagium TaxID=715481 RepID=UPI00351A98A3|nr:hypothetical protein LSM04_005128 [Trypanosoma melophagium]